MPLSEFLGPWFEGGSGSSSEVPSVWPVAIHGHGYLIEPKLYRRAFIPVQRDTRDDTFEPGEQTLSPVGLWRRSQSDWSLGAGQDWLDEENSTRRRFRTSLGVDVFGEERKVSLLPTVEEKRSTANTNLKILRVGLRLYVVDGATLIFSNGSGSEQNATWVTGWTTATGLPGGNILDIATSGSHIYVLGSDNSIYRATPGTTAFTLYYNPTAVATRIFTGLGRLFMSDNRAFYEVTATPGETLIFTHPDPNFVTSACVAAPTGIYFGGNLTEGGEIRHTWVRDDGAAFVAPVVAAEFYNEQVNCLASAGNNLLIGTSVGLRYSPIDGQNTGLDFGPVISAVGSIRQIILDTVNAETFAWFTWTNITSGNSGAGRIRVARFTEVKVPAYAADIYSAAGGTSITIASLSGRRYFGISADGFFGATANKVTSATLTTGRIRYGMLDAKVFADLVWRTSALPAGAEVFATLTFDTGTIRITETQFNAGSTESAIMSLGPTTAEWVEITFTLERATDTTTGPELRAWVLRSVPAPQTTQQFMVPLRLSRKVQPPNGPVHMLHSDEELEFLAALIRSQEIVQYQEGRSAYEVHVVNYQVQGVDWDRTHQHLDTIAVVEMHSLI